ncbi:MAG: four helix bundle protein [Bacteroidota bacterium]
MAYKDFTEMPVWKKAFYLLLLVYRLTKKYPAEEKFFLVSDMRRAAHSVTNNTAEGFGRYESFDKTRFYKIARGSCYELINQSLASRALDYITSHEKDELVNGYRDVISELDSMIKTIETTKKEIHRY